MKKMKRGTEADQILLDRMVVALADVVKRFDRLNLRPDAMQLALEHCSAINRERLIRMGASASAVANLIEIAQEAADKDVAEPGCFISRPYEQPTVKS